MRAAYVVARPHDPVARGKNHALVATETPATHAVDATNIFRVMSAPKEKDGKRRRVGMD